MSVKKTSAIPDEGLRARKRRETAQRITDAGMSLFIERGFEATTLDDIADKAGISRRTFFYYFKSKDDILLSMKISMGEMIVVALKKQSVKLKPIEAVRRAIIEVCALVPEDEMIVIDQLMRSSPVVQARRQAIYVQYETALFTALCERYGDPKRKTNLRLVAMMSMGAVRLATDTFNNEEGRRSLVEILNEVFDALGAEISKA